MDGMPGAWMPSSTPFVFSGMPVKVAPLSGSQSLAIPTNFDGSLPKFVFVSGSQLAKVSLGYSLSVSSDNGILVTTKGVMLLSGGFSHFAYKRATTQLSRLTVCPMDQRVDDAERDGYSVAADSIVMTLSGGDQEIVIPNNALGVKPKRVIVSGDAGLHWRVGVTGESSNQQGITQSDNAAVVADVRGGDRLIAIGNGFRVSITPLEE